MSAARRLVREVIEATRFHSSTRYSWFGRMSPRLPPRILAALTARSARDHLVHSLAEQLYRDFYVRGRAEPAQWTSTSPTVTLRTFEAALSAANCGRGYVDGGWQLRAVERGWAVVAKDGLELTMNRSEVLGDDDGEAVALRMPKELLRIAPGFYTACGDTSPEVLGTEPLLRLYWHLSPSGAIPFVSTATRRLNAARIAFRLKVLNDPGSFNRCDAGVIYLNGSQAWRAAAQAVHDDVAGHLLPRIPAFTESLAPGLGMAQDPGTGESFGQHRCRLLADGLVSAFERGTTGADATTAVIAARFDRDGIDLDAPHRTRSGPVRT